MKNCESRSKVPPRGTCRLGLHPGRNERTTAITLLRFLLPLHVFPFLLFLRSLFNRAKLGSSLPRARSLFVPDCLLAGTFSKTNWPVASLNTKLDRLMTDFVDSIVWISLSPWIDPSLRTELGIDKISTEDRVNNTNVRGDCIFFF